MRGTGFTGAGGRGDGLALRNLKDRVPTKTAKTAIDTKWNASPRVSRPEAVKNPKSCPTYRLSATAQIRMNVDNWNRKLPTLFALIARRAKMAAATRIPTSVKTSIAVVRRSSAKLERRLFRVIDSERYEKDDRHRLQDHLSNVVKPVCQGEMIDAVGQREEA